MAEFHSERKKPPLKIHSGWKPDLDIDQATIVEVPSFNKDIYTDGSLSVNSTNAPTSTSNTQRSFLRQSSNPLKIVGSTTNSCRSIKKLIEGKTETNLNSNFGFSSKLNDREVFNIKTESKRNFTSESSKIKDSSILVNDTPNADSSQRKRRRINNYDEDNDNIFSTSFYRNNKDFFCEAKENTKTETKDLLQSFLSAPMKKSRTPKKSKKLDDISFSDMSNSSFKSQKVRKSESLEFDDFSPPTKFNPSPKKPKAVRRRKLDNINIYLQENEMFRKVLTDDGFKIICLLCKREDIVNRSKASFWNGLKFSGEKAEEIESGGSQIWYSLKLCLNRHKEFHDLPDIGSSTKSISKDSSSTSISKMMDKRRSDNIHSYMQEHELFSKVPIDGGFKIFCVLCKETGKPSKTKPSLTTGLEFIDQKAIDVETGGSQAWYQLKQTLNRHVEIHKTDRIQSSVARNILAIALSAIKLKHTNENFSNLLSIFEILGVDVGPKRLTFTSLQPFIQMLRSYSQQRLTSHILTPLMSTSMPQHFSIALNFKVKNSIDYQMIMLIINTNGIRKTIPIDCLMTYSNDENDSMEDESSKGKDRATVVLNVIKERLNLKSDNLFPITTIYADSSYDYTFYTQIKRQIGISDDCYFFIIYDIAEWIDDCVKKVTSSMKFFDIFTKRCQKFQSIFKIENVEGYEDETSATGPGALIETELSRIKYTHKFLRDLKKYFNYYPSIFAQFDVETSYDINTPIGFFFQGRDFVIDLCVSIDILNPIVEFISKLQIGSFPPWKVATWFPRLFKILHEMSDNLRVCVERNDSPSNYLFPFLHPNWDGIIVEKRISDSLNEVDDISTTLGGGSSSSSSAANAIWKIRNLKTCLMDYRSLCEDLRKNLFEIYQGTVSEGLRDLARCFDLENMLDELVDVDEYNGRDKPESFDNYYKRGQVQFEKFYHFLLKRRHLTDRLDPNSAKETFRCWKSTFQDLIWNYSHTKGTWFVDKNGGKIRLTSEIKTIRFANEDGITNTFYELHLSDGSVVSGVLFSETEFMKFFTTDVLFLERKGVTKQVQIVIDYVYSMSGAENYFEEFYRTLRDNEQLSGGKDTDLMIDRAIVDCVYPHASQCLSTLEDIAAAASKAGTFLSSSNKRSTDNSDDFKFSLDKGDYKLPVRFPFILNQKDLGKIDR